MKNRRFGGPAGKILTLLLILAAAGVIYVVHDTNMIPTKYLILGGVAAAILIGLVGYLTWNFNHRGRFVIGLFLWFAILMVFAVAAMYVTRTHTTISDIATPDVEVSEMGLFVAQTSTATSAAETAGSTVGILRDLDRNNTDAAIEKFSEDMGSTPTTVEYDGLTELVDSLTSGETGAIIMNTAYLDVVRDLDGYAALDSMIRQVETKSVETELQPAVTQPTVAYGGSSEGVVSTDSTEGGSQPAVAENVNKDVIVVYISGIDNRGGIVAKSRSDVNIVAVANMKTKQMLLINTPRDFFVPLSISNGAPDKLTHAGIYGINCSMDTLSMLYNVSIPYYIKVNFQGFIDIINALGGIDVYSDYEFDSKNELGWHYTQGMNHMDGEAALTYARERFSFADGDRQRGKNQMAVIEGIMAKASSTELLTNYTAIMKSLEGSFETNISYDEIARILQKQLDEPGAWNMVTYSVNGTGGTEKPYSLSTPAYVMIPDQSTVDTAKALIQDVINDMVLQQVDEEITPLLSPEEADAVAAEANGLLTPTPDPAAPAAGGAAAPMATEGTVAAPVAPDASVAVPVAEPVAEVAVPAA
ncbi:MAG: LCP family protein [Blautia sp.]|nr:LCP family protein [Blautia sp.]